MKPAHPNMFMIALAAAVAVFQSVAALAAVTFEWELVDHPGNAPDPLNSGTVPGIGSVDYQYWIARYEVTNDQYAEFLNAVATTDTNGLYNASMGSDPRGGITLGGACGETYCVKANMGNKPVNYVSFFDAMRFVNWLHNGQPTGAQDSTTTEAGVYTVTDGLSETRAADARFFIPTNSEWYKAAYYQPSTSGGDTDDYWLYPTRSNSMPTHASADTSGDIANPGTNVANYAFNADWNGQDGNVTTVGSAGAASESFYGTSDQGGNVWEWNESFVALNARGLRGGSWGTLEINLRSSDNDALGPDQELDAVGFRVARPLGDVPTVSSWGVVVLALLILTAAFLTYVRRVARTVTTT